MAAFPNLKTGAVLQYPAERQTSQPVRVLWFVDGTEQRFRTRGAVVRRWIVRLDLLDEEEMRRLESFFVQQQGRLGSFEFLDPWDGVTYSDCSLEDDVLELDYRDWMKGRSALIIRANGS